MLRLLLTLIGTHIAMTSFAADADHDLLLKVKHALAQEPTLRAVNLTISIFDGVAVVGGAVPSAAANAEIERIVKAVPGVAAVRADCWVTASQDPLQAALKAKLKLASAPSVATAVLPPRLFVGTPYRGETAAYSPVPPPIPPAPPGPAQYPTIPSPRVPMVPGQDVAAAVEAIRRSDVRFDGLTLSVNAGTIVIAGTGPEGSEAWSLAAAVRKVPGVDKVVVGRTIGR